MQKRREYLSRYSSFRFFTGSMPVWSIFFEIVKNVVIKQAATSDDKEWRGLQRLCTTSARPRWKKWTLSKGISSEWAPNLHFKLRHRPVLSFREFPVVSRWSQLLRVTCTESTGWLALSMDAALVVFPPHVSPGWRLRQSDVLFKVAMRCT